VKLAFPSGLRSSESHVQGAAREAENERETTRRAAEISLRERAELQMLCQALPSYTCPQVVVPRKQTNARGTPSWHARALPRVLCRTTNRAPEPEA
jgi:hypothetical protein